MAVLSSISSESFRVLALDVPFSTSGSWSWSTNSAHWYNTIVGSTGAVNDTIVFKIPRLRGGTWSLALAHRRTAGGGIYTIAVSPDGSTFTDLTTIDGYAAANDNQRTVVTDLVIPAGTRFVRIRTATKNDSSSGYAQTWSSLTGVRTS